MASLKATVVLAQRAEGIALPGQPLSSAGKVISQDAGMKALNRASLGVKGYFPQVKALLFLAEDDIWI